MLTHPAVDAHRSFGTDACPGRTEDKECCCLHTMRTERRQAQMADLHVTRAEEGDAWEAEALQPFCRMHITVSKKGATKTRAAGFVAPE